MSEKRENATTGGTMRLRVYAALCRSVPRFGGGPPIMVGSGFTHNAGVGSSSLPPATRPKPLSSNRMARAWAFVVLVARKLDATIRGTTYHQLYQKDAGSGGGLSRPKTSERTVPEPRRPIGPTGRKDSSRVAFELSVRQIQRDREQRAIDLAFRSGTWPRFLG